MADSENRYRVLVVDDDRELLQVLEAMLTFEGFEVDTCESGLEALTKVRAERPDLLVLDVLLPGKSGIDVMMELRADPATREIPILFLSAVGEESVVVRGLKGGDDYIVKPFKPLELDARIRKILSRGSKPSAPGADRPARRPSRLPVEVGNDVYLLPLDQVCFFSAAGKYAYAHTKSRKLLTGFSIGELEKKLEDDDRFLRVHRSHMVNVDCLVKITRDDSKKTVLVLADENGTRLRVSESYLKQVRSRLGLD